MRPPLAITREANRTVTPTPAFAALYRRAVRRLNEVFPPSENPQSVYPPADPQQFVRERFQTAPAMHRAIATELWTLLKELEKLDYRVNRKQLHEHQLAHLIWVSTAVTEGPDSPNSFFIQGAPGTGKTLTLGVLMQACIRLQQRDRLTGKIAYCTARPYHLSDKVRGKGMGLRRVLRTPPYALSERDMDRRRRALSRMNPEFIRRCFPARDWKWLCRQEPDSEQEAECLVAEFLEARNREVDSSEQAILRSVIKVLASRATMVRGPASRTELLELPPVPQSGQQVVTHTGDAAFAIPPEYPVFARENVGIGTTTREAARVILEPATIFTSSRQIELHRHEVHRHVQIILCDEAQRREPIAFQEPVIGAGAAEVPLVFAAGSRWYDKKWERRSPVHSFPESIRRAILPDLGVRVFPSAPQTHYPAETKEALDQFFKNFQQPLESFQEFKLLQPHEVNTLVVVHNRLVDPVVERLRKSLKKPNVETLVRPFHGNEEDREALQIWFDSSDTEPHILVSTPAIVKESLDLLSIRHLAIGTRVSADALFHLMGRLAHGRDRRKRSDRLLVTLQQFADSNLAATPFVAIDHGQEFPEGGFTWINGHTLMSARAFQRDARRLRHLSGRECVQIPGHSKRQRHSKSSIRRNVGKSLLPGREGQLVDPANKRQTKASSPLALLPQACPEYDPKLGPPSREMARFWAAECGGLTLFELYPSIMLAVEEAHYGGDDPRQALQQKIARLRERSGGVNGQKLLF